MRTHPLGIICLPFDRNETYRIATKYSKVTHVDPRCVVSCCIATVLISEMLKGTITTEKEIDEVIESAFDWVSREYRPNGEVQNHPLDREEFEHYLYIKTMIELQLDDSQKMGYVYKTLGSAILCLRLAIRSSWTSMDRFEVIITDLVMQGGDADTNACCAAALVGAFYGYSRLPQHWRDGLMHLDWLVEKTEALCLVSGISEGEYNGSADPATQTDDERGRLPKEALEEREKYLMTTILLKEKERNEKHVSDRQGENRSIGRFFRRRHS